MSSTEAQAPSLASSSIEQQQQQSQSASDDPAKMSSPSSQAEGVSSTSQQSGRRSLASNPSTSNSSASIASSTTSSQRASNQEKLLSSNADYDNIRNTTLLFFLDRLYIASREGKEARTLHELSCLFGTRDFTKEMRQIVGASRNGLKRFLQSYPSLFTIEGDKVLLTQLKQESLAPVRDYNREAVEYFTNKLLQFGTSLVPIKNLFGYRSQASHEVRHVSGKNTRDFKQFLRAHDDVFEILADEHVVLKSSLPQLEQSLGQTQSELQLSLPPTEGISMDPYLNKQFALSIEECMRKLTEVERAKNSKSESNSADTTEQEETAFRISLECLHDKIKQSCQNELFLKMVETIEDLRVFLRMHPKLFKRFKCDQDGKEYVSLLSETERKELEAQLYPSLSVMQHRQHSTLDRTHSQQSTATSNAQEEDCDSSLPSSINHPTNHLHQHHNHHQQPLSLPPMVLAKRQPSAAASTAPSGKPEKKTGTALRSLSNTTTTTTTTSQSNHNQNHSTSSARNNNNNSSNGCNQSSLRATAPPFVPSKFDKKPTVGLGQRQNSHLSQQATRLADSQPPPPATMQQRSLSNLGPRWQRAPGGPIDQRGAIRNYLMKAQSNDHSSVNNNLHWSSAIQQQQQQQQHHHHQQYNQNNNNGYSQYSSKFLADQQQQQRHHLQNGASGNADYLRSRTVDIVREASNIVTRIMNTCDAVAFDCKGYNLGFDGQITLIQFGFLPNESKLANSELSSLSKNENNNNNHDDGDGNRRAARLPDGRLKPEVCVFDLITNPELAYCLKPLLESDKIIKVVHDVRNKSNALHVQFKIVLSNVFDTQVANLVIQQQDTGKPAYKSRYISMSKLCEIYGDEELMKYRNMIKSKTRHNLTATTTGGGQQQTGTAASSRQIKDVNYWRARPLTNSMIFEATMDVYCLVGGIYQNLSSKIKAEYKPLFDQLNLEGVLARIKPDEIRSAKKERKIDLEVIDLKRKLYGDTKSSIVLSNREIRLLRHIDLTEEVRNKIQQCKKVAKKLERLDMKAAQLKSLNSQLSTDTNDPQQQSLGGLETANHGSSSSSASSQATSLESNNSNNQFNSETQNLEKHQQQQSEVHKGQLCSDNNVVVEDDTTADVMTNLMDGSMFDELKDKMIESSSLLESLEDDDDDDHLSGANHHHLSLHSHSGTNHDCCHCQCHRSSTDASVVGDAQDLSLKSNVSKTTSNNNNNSLLTSCDNMPTTADETTTTQEENDQAKTKLQSDQSKPQGEEVVDIHIEDQTKSSASSAAVDMAIQCDLLS